MSLLKYFHPVLPGKELRHKPVAVKIGDEAVVLFRNKEGVAAALKDRCPHRFTPLSEGSVNDQGHITCPYHGWQFNEAGDGKKPGNSEHCRVHSYRIVEKYNYLWIAEKNADDSTLPQLDEAGFVLLDSYSITFQAPFHVVLDNFSEDEHFPFVHSMFGWSEAQIPGVEFSSRQVGGKIEVNYWGPQRKFFGMSLLFARPGQYFENRWTQEYDPVRFTYRVRLTDKDKNHVSPGTNKVAIYFIPVSPTETKLHIFQFSSFRKAFWYKILPLIKPTFLALIRNDIRNDAALTKKLQNVPYSLKGMALSKYDEPLRLGRELLEKVYFGHKPGPAREPSPPEGSMDRGDKFQ